MRSNFSETLLQKLTKDLEIFLDSEAPYSIELTILDVNTDPFSINLEIAILGKDNKSLIVNKQTVTNCSVGSIIILRGINSMFNVSIER